MEGRKDRIADALRELVQVIYKECKGAYGAGEDGYEGQFEEEIKNVAEAIIKSE